MQQNYNEIRDYSTSEIEIAITRSIPSELRVVILGAAMHHEDCEFVEGLCRKFSTSEDEELRGNAILGFGHLARRFGNLEESNVRPLIENALLDSSEYVRGQASAAAEDAVHFLGWKVKGFEA